MPIASAAILVDEEFCADILRDATRNGFVTALSVEKSGSAEFQFEYGDAFAQHIEAFQPTFAKALVRYNPEGDALLNERQTARLKQLSEYCRAVGQRFMFELLVPATEAQRARAQADAATYDLRMRPSLMLQAIRTLQDAGVEPDIWKIEGLDRREDCERLVAAARRDGLLRPSAEAAAPRPRRPVPRVRMIFTAHAPWSLQTVLTSSSRTSASGGCSLRRAAS